MKLIAAKVDELCMKRLQKGFSMRKLSRNADLDVVTIHRIENRKSSYVSATTANKLCSALDVPFDELFEIIEIKKAKE